MGRGACCFASAQRWPWLGGRSRLALPPSPGPALPLYIVNKQCRSTLAIAGNLIAFVLVVSGRGREARRGRREGEVGAPWGVGGGEGGGSMLLKKLKCGLLVHARRQGNLITIKV